MKNVRKKASAVTGVSGFFSGKVSTSVALPITDVEAQADGYIIPDESSVRIVVDNLGAEERSDSTNSNPSLLRPLRKVASKVTGVRGLFSGKDPSTVSQHETPVARRVRTDIGLHQNLLRGSMKSGRNSGDKVCCGGFLGPLMLTQDGAAERLQVRQIVPWAAVTITGMFICIHAVLSFLFLYDNLFWHHYISVGNIFYYFVVLGPVPYLICWIFGFRLALASCSVCRTQVPLPMWHRWLSSVPVLGISVLITYAPWLMAITSSITALPHYVINVLFLYNHEATVLQLCSALSALLVIVLTPAHIVVMVSLRNDRRLGKLSTSRRDGDVLRNHSLIASSHLSRSRSESDMSTSSQRSRGHDFHESSRERSRSRSRSPSANRSLTILSRGISKLYCRRLLGVLAVVTAPIMLDMIQCLPLIAAHYFLASISDSLYLTLLLCFLLPRLALLALSALNRRIRYDMASGAYVETFEYSSVFSIILGIGRTKEDIEVWELETKSLDPLWDLKCGPCGLITGRCFITVRYVIVCLMVVVFPHTAALFLILDNVAKVAAAGERLVGTDGETGVQGGFLRSDREAVEVGPEDQENSIIFASYLVVAFGSQIFLCHSLGWPVLSHERNLDARVTCFVIWLQVMLALSLSLAVTTGLGTRVWRRVRVVFANRASLWLSATSRERGVPAPHRVLSPGRRPVRIPHPETPLITEPIGV